MRTTSICVTLSLLLTLVLYILTGMSYPTDSDSIQNGAIPDLPHVTTTPRIPDEVDFCGEIMPLDITDVREAFDRELLINTFSHSRTVQYIKRASKYFPVIEPILEEYGIPQDFKYLAVIESDLLPLTISPAKAAGLWQILETTGKEYGLEVNSEVDERYNTERSTIAACKYLRKAYEKFGSWTLVAASYNAGMNRVSKNMENQKQNNFYNLLFGDETTRYIYRITSVKTIMSNPEKYGFMMDDEELYHPTQAKIIEINSSISDIAQWAIDNGTNYKRLKVLNPWLRDNRLSNAKGKIYKIAIPE